jgi:hypothetical protein
MNPKYHRDERIRFITQTDMSESEYIIAIHASTGDGLDPLEKEDWDTLYQDLTNYIISHNATHAEKYHYKLLWITYEDHVGVIQFADFHSYFHLITYLENRHAEFYTHWRLPYMMPEHVSVSIRLPIAFEVNTRDLATLLTKMTYSSNLFKPIIQSRYEKNNCSYLKMFVHVNDITNVENIEIDLPFGGTSYIQSHRNSFDR